MEIRGRSKWGDHMECLHTTGEYEIRQSIHPDDVAPAIAKLNRHEKKYRAEREAVGVAPFDDAVEAARDVFDESLDLLIETPAQTLPGVRAKMAIFAERIAIGDHPSDDEFAQSIIADLDRLIAGERVWS